jgi:hypothetical protein
MRHLRVGPNVIEFVTHRSFLDHAEASQGYHHTERHVRRPLFSFDFSDGIHHPVNSAGSVTANLLAATPSTHFSHHDVPTVLAVE